MEEGIDARFVGPSARRLPYETAAAAAAAMSGRHREDGVVDRRFIIRFSASLIVKQFRAEPEIERRAAVGGSAVLVPPCGLVFVFVLFDRNFKISV